MRILKNQVYMQLELTQLETILKQKSSNNNKTTSSKTEELFLPSSNHIIKLENQKPPVTKLNIILFKLKL